MSQAIFVSHQELISLASTARHWARMPKGLRSSLLSGVSRSQQKGRGLEFAEVRQYQPGDEIRSIDWKVSARKSRTHTKLFTEEREKPVLVFCDLSPGMFFGSRVQFKSSLAIRAAAFIAWLAAEQGDKLGGIVSNHLTHNELKPMPRQTGVLKLIKWMEGYQPESPEILNQPLSRDFNQNLHTLAAMARPGTRIFLISDFSGFNATSPIPLAKLAKHCEIQAIHVYDPLESQLPSPGFYRVSNGGKEVTLDSSSKSKRSQFERDFRYRCEGIKNQLNSLGQGYIQLKTNSPFSNYLPGLARLVCQ